MLNICDDIDEANAAYAEIAYMYAHKAIFGNDTEDMFFVLLRLNFYISVLERNMPEVVHEKSSTLTQGSKVEFSALTRQNNNLILAQSYNCVTRECRPCLSDEEICSIVQKAKLLYSCI